MGEPCFIIAEVGANHDGKLSQAKELIDIAADSGADGIKFQVYSADTLFSEKSTAFAVIRENEVPREWLGELAQYARNKGLVFLATPFDKKAVDQLFEISVPAYKWASLEIVNLPLLKYAASKGKPMILSTGICNLANIQDAIDTVYSVDNKNIILLHCTLTLPNPTEPHQLNLRMMDTMRDAFHLPIGLSDHTAGFVMTVAAVARGACVIEKHFTLSRNLKGPDHPFALEPEELKQMVRAIRDVDKSLGSPIKGLIPAEKEVPLLRPSIIAKMNIPKGSILTKEMLIIKRPGYGVEPKFLDIIINREVKKDIEKGDGITWDLI